MKISELMEKLGELQGLHGDVEVYLDRFDGDAVAKDFDLTIEKPDFEGQTDCVGVLLPETYIRIEP